VYFDDEMIGWVSGETGGDYQNLVKIPPHASVGSHELRIGETFVRSSTTFEVTQARQCVGDCNGDAGVTIDELIAGVNILLARSPLDACMQFDANADATVSVAELIAAIAGGLGGCVDAIPASSFAGEYLIAVSEATDFSPGAVQTFDAEVTASPEGALLIEFPYWPGVVHVVASFSFDGAADLNGSVVLEDSTASPVSGEAFVATDGDRRWITGTVTLDRFQRSELVNFVMWRGEG
jgi:hypothetical protein